MTPWNRVVLVLECVLALVALAGLVKGRQLHTSWFFGFYLLAIAVSDAFVIVSPRQFFTVNFWLAQQILLSSAKLAIALELTLRMFQALPRARAAVSTIQLGVLFATF